MQWLDSSIRAFRAEIIKMKGTGMWWIVGIISSLVPVVSTVFAISQKEKDPEIKNSPWENFLQSEYSSFMFLYTLMLILIASRLCQTEHRNQGWKLIETQPIHRAHLYLAKFKLGAILSLIGLILFGLLALAGVRIYALLRDDRLYLDHAIPWGAFLLYVFRIWIAGWGMYTLQYVLSLWIPGFIWPFVVGFIGIIAGPLMAQLGEITWVPYGFPQMSAGSFRGGVFRGVMLHHEWLSIAWTLILLLIGYLYYFRRSWKQLFISRSSLVRLAAGIVLFALAFMWIERPVLVTKHNRTVIAGDLGNDSLNGSVLMLSVAMRDTVMTSPVTNGKFHTVYAGRPLETGEYILNIGGKSLPVFMGENDSIFVQMIKSRFGEEPKIGGTRIAENSFNKRLGFSSYLEQSLPSMEPATMANMLFSNWESDMKTLDRYKTADNIKPAADFLDIMKRKASISYLEVLKYRYPVIHATYFPNKKLEYQDAKYIQPLMGAVSTDDSTLVSYEEYIKFLEKDIRFRNKLNDAEYDSTYLSKIREGSQHSRVKDALLYHGIRAMLSSYSDSLGRDRLFRTFVDDVKDPVRKQRLKEKLEIENALGRDKPAPAFEAESLAGSDVSLKDLKGRYVVVDVWATWCGPCKEQTPLFERYAAKYAGEKISFVGLSVDDGDDTYKWRTEAAAKSPRVMQVRAKDKFDFMTKYDIETIPRFMLIDPEGKIRYLSMPRPSDRGFEDLIKECL